MNELMKPIVIFDELSTEVIEEIIWRAVELNASDIHVMEDEPVILDVGPKKVPITTKPLKASACDQFCLTMLNNEMSLMTQVKRSTPTYSNYNITNPQNPTIVRSFRVCVLTQRSLYNRKTPTLTARLNPLIPKSAEELGIETNLVKNVLHNHQGIGLFIGGTGQGKTTTMAGINVSILKTEGANKKIMVFEDPVEIQYTYVKKATGNTISSFEVGPRELDSDVQSFDEGLHAALRSKPDILVQGEIRTKEALNKTIDFSNTGHFVMATLHANSCASALVRIYNLIDGEDRLSILTNFLTETRFICANRIINTNDGGRLGLREILFIDKDLRETLLACTSTVDLKKEVINALEKTGQSFEQKLNQLWLDGMISPSLILGAN